MNELQIFENPEFGEIRVTINEDGEPLFVAADVCRVLEHSNVTMALERLDDDEKAKLDLGLSGGLTNCVTEPGLYSLVLGSRKKEARAFKRWITPRGHPLHPQARGVHDAPDPGAGPAEPGLPDAAGPAAEGGAAGPEGGGIQRPSAGPG